MADTLIGVSEAYLQLPEAIRDRFIPYVPTRRDDKPVSAAVIRLLTAQGNRCAYCGGHMRLHGSIHHMRRATIDHVTPRAKGGGNNGNRVLAHRRCNATKGARLPKPCELLLLHAVNTRLTNGSEVKNDHRG